MRLKMCGSSHSVYSVHSVVKTLRAHNFSKRFSSLGISVR
jgi:hypothetical protein